MLYDIRVCHEDLGETLTENGVPDSRENLEKLSDAITKLMITETASATVLGIELRLQEDHQVSGVFHVLDTHNIIVGAGWNTPK